ncbi:MAG: hypothetical protein ACKV2T_24805 [Kofleriaceae bacterium]
MDLLDHRGRAIRLLVAAIVGAAAGVGVVVGFAEVLEPDYSSAPTWFAMFTWSMTFVLVTLGVNALLTGMDRRRVRIPRARVVRG